MYKRLKENRTYVFVKNFKGEPLMPCSPAKARRLLRDGEAKVVDFEPFTIRLKYGSAGYKQKVTLGVDTGSAHVGLCASTLSSVLMLMELNLRTDIVDKISTRKMCRRTRRSRKTRYRKARFNNRTSSKKDSWLPPSIEYKITKHLNIINYISTILPVTEYRVEELPVYSLRQGHLQQNRMFHNRFF